MKKLNNIYTVLLVLLLVAGGFVAGVSAAEYVMAPWEEEFYEEYRNPSLYEVGIYDVYYPFWFDYYLYEEENEDYYNELLMLYTERKIEAETVTPTPTETIIPTETVEPTPTETVQPTDTPTQTETVTPTETVQPTPTTTPDKEEEGLPVVPVAVAGVIVLILVIGAVIFIKQKKTTPAVKSEPVEPVAEKKPASDVKIEIRETDIGVDVDAKTTSPEKIQIEPEQPVIPEQVNTPETVSIEEPVSVIEPEIIVTQVLTPKEAYAAVVKALDAKYEIPALASLTPRQLLDAVEPTAELSEFIHLYEQTRYARQVNTEQTKKLSELAALIQKQYSA